MNGTRVSFAVAVGALAVMVAALLLGEDGDHGLACAREEVMSVYVPDLTGFSSPDAVVEALGVMIGRPDFVRVEESTDRVLYRSDDRLTEIEVRRDAFGWYAGGGRECQRPFFPFEFTTTTAR